MENLLYSWPGALRLKWREISLVAPLVGRCSNTDGARGRGAGLASYLQISWD